MKKIIISSGNGFIGTNLIIKLLDYIKIGRVVTWLDLGSFENIYQCSEFVRLIEKR